MNAVKPIRDLEPSESNLRRVIDTIPALSWCAKADGSMEFLNRRWHDYTGLSPDETGGSGYQAAFHPEDRADFGRKCHELLGGDGQAETEVRLRRYDGIYRWFLVRVEPLRNEKGQIVRWYGTSTDINALKQSEVELRAITDAIPQAIVVLDPTGVPIYANNATLEYTGLVKRDVVQPGFRERIFHPDDLERLRESRTIALERGVPFEIEQRARRRDGLYRWFLIQYNPYRDEQGQEREYRAPRRVRSILDV